MKITEAAGVAQGTFYLYFAGKKEVFDELVRRPQPPRPPRDEGGELEGHDARSSRRSSASAPTSASRPSTRRSTGHPPGGVRLARDAALPLRAPLRGLRRGAHAKRSSRGEIGDVDPTVTAWALMGMGELIGMRWILLEPATSMPKPVLRELERIIGCVLEAGCVTSASPRSAAYLPERWMTRGRDRSGERHPRGRRRREVRPARQAHRGRGRARQRPVGRGGRGACSTSTRSIRAAIDAVVYFGSMWKDYAVWQAAPWIAHRLGARTPYAVEYDNVSCGGAGGAAPRAQLPPRGATSSATCCSSAPRASRTCSTTRTSAPASCSTSATARSRCCSSAAHARTSCSARTRSPTARSRCR